MNQLRISKERERSSKSYLSIAGTALIFSGILYLLLSLLPAVVAFGHEKAINPNVEGFAAFGWLVDAVEWSPRGMVAAGLILQLTLGWILGLFTIVAGWRAMHGQNLSFVRRVTIANLFYLPIGSTIGAMTLVGLKRPTVAAQFNS